MYKNYSVLMSVYFKERPEWLRIAIESMLNQTVLTNDFVIIKDGKLTPELDDVLNEFKHKFDFINIYEIEDNVGLGLALNKGVKLCKNELIARMDSDDYSIPNRCEQLLIEFENNDKLDIVGSYEAEFENTISNVLSIHRVPESNQEIHNFMKRRCAILHPTVMYKKSSVIKSGNYRHVPLYEDYDLFVRMCENNCVCKNIKKDLYYIRINDNFYKRRGGFSYMKTALNFKYNQYRMRRITFIDFFISAGSQCIVSLLPNTIRKKIYLNLLRK